MPASTESLQQRCWHAAGYIAGGGVIAYPTEAVFGLGCDPLNQSALQRILSIKHRAEHKGFIVVAGDESQLDELIGPLPESSVDAIRASWPGPVTWVVPAAAGVPAELTGGRNTLAVRVSAHPVIRLVCEKLNAAIVSTSANVSGHAEMHSAADVRAEFGDSLDYIVDAPLGDSQTTSRIFDASTLKQLR